MFGATPTTEPSGSIASTGHEHVLGSMHRRARRGRGSPARRPHSRRRRSRRRLPLDLELPAPARARARSPSQSRVPVGDRQHRRGRRTPVAGATVRAGSVSATTGADGTAARRSRSAAGRVKATRPRHAASRPGDGADGGVRPRAAPPPDTTAPAATIAGIRDGQRFSRRRAPRELHGTASDDPSGPVGVKLRLTRKLGRPAGTSPAQGAVPQAHVRQEVRVQGRRAVGVELPAPVAPAARALRARRLRDRQRVQPQHDRRVRFRVR